MRTVSVNIGTNLGDREANLRRAVDEIARSVGSTPRVSSIYESEAWGYQSDNPFFNIAVEFESDLPVGRLLDIFQRIEREAGSSSHRNADGSYADRQLDIDIVYAGDEVVDTARCRPASSTDGQTRVCAGTALRVVARVAASRQRTYSGGNACPSACNRQNRQKIGH